MNEYEYVWIKTRPTAGAKKAFHTNGSCKYLFKGRGRLRQQRLKNALLSGRVKCAYCSGSLTATPSTVRDTRETCSRCGKPIREGFYHTKFGTYFQQCEEVPRVRN